MPIAAAFAVDTSDLPERARYISCVSQGAPIVRFFRKTGGEQLAYAVHGAGPHLVCPAWWVSHVEEDWQNPGFRALFGGLAQRFTIIRYDRPGAGLSDRCRAVVDLEGEVDSLAQLVDHLQLERFSLLAVSCAGPVTLTYASAHPERVDRLVFFGSFVNGRDVGPPPIRDALQGLVRAHWGMGSLRSCSKNRLGDLGNRRVPLESM